MKKLSHESKSQLSFPVVIAAICLIAVAATFGVWGIFSTAKAKTIDQATLNEAKLEADKMIPQTDQKLEDTIENALIESTARSTDSPAGLNLSNPFGNSLNAKPETKYSAQNQIAAVSGNRSVPFKQEVKTGIVAGNVVSPQSNVPNAQLNAGKMPVREESPLLPSFESRYRMWQAEVTASRNDKTYTEPNIGKVYTAAEVLPTGTITSGSRRLINFEVIVPNQDSFYMSPGDRLFDAVIAEANDEGVIFQFADGRQTFVKYITDRELLKKSSVTEKNNSGNATISPVSQAAKTTEILKSVVSKSDSVQLDNLVAAVNDDSDDKSEKPIDQDYFHKQSVIGNIRRSLSTKPDENVNSQDISPCDANFVGEPISYKTGSNLMMTEFLRALQNLYGVSFIVDKEVGDEEIVLRVSDKPWNLVLEAILRSKNLEARCLAGGIISIEPKGKQAKVEIENQKSEPLIMRKYALRYIPLNSSSSTQIAGTVGSYSGGSGGGVGATGQGIESELNRLLARGGDNRASISRVPNSNILAIYATNQQHQEIKNFLEEIDKPGFQVIIETNYYTVQKSNFKDLGGQLSVIVGNSSGTNFGGLTNLPPATGGEDSGGGTTTNAPGDIKGFPTGYGTPSNALRANANTLFAAGFTVGTASFNAVFSAAEQRGLVNSQARSTQAVLDGGTTEIKNGDTIIIPTTGSVGGSLVNSGAVTVNATQSAALQPQVVVDDNGNPIAVTLNMQLTNNSINRAFLGSSTPVVATQTQSGTVRLPLNQTYVVSGFFFDSVVNSRIKTPGLGSVPLLGDLLFKRRIDQVDRNRLYFAISVRVVKDIDLINIPAPADIDTKPVPAPDSQKPEIRKN